MKLSNVSSKYGAPMGRPNTLPDDTEAPIELTLYELAWVDGDYDAGGAYWGGSDREHIYCADGDGWPNSGRNGPRNDFLNSKPQPNK